MTTIKKNDVNILTRQRVCNKLKRKAMDGSCEKPCMILHWELRDKDTSCLTTTYTIRIRKTIYYTLSSMILMYPTNLDELHLALIYLGEIRTNRGDNFCLNIVKKKL